MPTPNVVVLLEEEHVLLVLQRGRPVRRRPDAERSVALGVEHALRVGHVVAAEELELLVEAELLVGLDELDRLAAAGGERPDALRAAVRGLLEVGLVVGRRRERREDRRVEGPARLLVGVLERGGRLLSGGVVRRDRGDAALAERAHRPRAERDAELVVRIRGPVDVVRLAVARERVRRGVRDDRRHLQLVDRVADAEQDAREEDPLDHVHLVLVHELLHLRIAVAGSFASSASMNWILRPPIRWPCARTYATKPRLTSIGGAEFGPLSVSRLPILSGFVADFRASPAHAPWRGCERHARNRRPDPRSLQELPAVEGPRRAVVAAHVVSFLSAVPSPTAPTLQRRDELASRSASRLSRILSRSRHSLCSARRDRPCSPRTSSTRTSRASSTASRSGC